MYETWEDAFGNKKIKSSYNAGNTEETTTTLKNFSTTTKTEPPCNFLIAEACGQINGFLNSFGHVANISCAVVGIFLNVVVIFVLCNSMKERRTKGQIHLLTLSLSDLFYLVCSANLAVLSWFCDACLPCHQLGHRHTAILVSIVVWLVAGTTNRFLTIVITWLRARAINNPYSQFVTKVPSPCRMLMELLGYTVVSSGISSAAIEIVRYFLIRNGASPARTEAGILIFRNSLWAVVMLSLAAYILIKLRRRKASANKAQRRRKEGDHRNLSNTEAEFQRLVALVALVFSLTSGVIVANMVVVFRNLPHDQPPQGSWGGFSGILNCSLNFFVYMAASRHFRNAFRSSFRRKVAKTDVAHSAEPMLAMNSGSMTEPRGAPSQTCSETPL